MSKSHRLAWAAGFFDGEGFVNIQNRSRPINGKFYEGLWLRIGINHVAIEPLLEMQDLFGGTIRKQSESTVKGNRKPRHMWGVSTQQAADVLKQLLPYLRNKNKVVELALEFQSTMQQHKKALSEETKTYRALLKQKIIALNSED